MPQAIKSHTESNCCMNMHSRVSTIPNSLERMAFNQELNVKSHLLGGIITFAASYFCTYMAIEFCTTNTPVKYGVHGVYTSCSTAPYIYNIQFFFGESIKVIFLLSTVKQVLPLLWQVVSELVTAGNTTQYSLSRKAVEI